MQFDSTPDGSSSQKRARPPGEVNAGLLIIVSGVLVGTCLTVAAFLTSTPSVDEPPLRECEVMAPDNAGCSCAGTTPKPGSTQPS